MGHLRQTDRVRRGEWASDNVLVGDPCISVTVHSDIDGLDQSLEDDLVLPVPDRLRPRLLDPIMNCDEMPVGMLRKAKLARKGLILLEIDALDRPKLVQKRMSEVRPRDGDALEPVEN